MPGSRGLEWVPEVGSEPELQIPPEELLVGIKTKAGRGIRVLGVRGGQGAAREFLS